MAAPIRLATFLRLPSTICNVSRNLHISANKCAVHKNVTEFPYSVNKRTSSFMVPLWNSRHQRGKIPKTGPSSLFFPILAFFGIKKAVEPERTSKAEDDIVMCIKQARLAERKGEYDRANKFYHQALFTVNEHEKRKDMSESELIDARVHIYDNMANLALSQGQFDKAENLYKETMRGLLEKKVDKTDNSIIEISLKLAMIYAMQRRYADSEKGYIFCVDTLDAKIKESSETDVEILGLYGMCLNSYSRFLMLRERLYEAEKYMDKCVQIGKATFGDSHPQVAVLLNDLATMQSYLKRYDSAAETIDKAIYIAENTASHDLPSLYCNKGEILLNQKKLEDAKETCKLALEMAGKFGDKEAEEKAQSCLNNCS